MTPTPPSTLARETANLLLLPCPFCGTIRGDKQPVLQSIRIHARPFRVCCFNCFAETAGYFTPTEAIAAWNNRLDQHLKDVTQRLDVIRNGIPQTYGEAIVKFPFIKCENHEWDNRRSEENALWIIEQLTARVKELEQEMLQVRLKCSNVLEICKERDQLRTALATAREALQRIHEHFKRVGLCETKNCCFACLALTDTDSVIS